MSKIKHITVTTTEQEIAFGATYQFAWFRNNSDVDVIVSDHSDIVEDADDTEIIKSNDVGRITITNRDKVYVKTVSDTAKIDVHAQNFSDCPFKKQGKGGEQITVESLTATENATYTAPSGTAYSPVTVNVPPSGVEIIDETDWDNMTKAQKQAKGVVAIQQFNSGYDRGVLVNGADYPPMPVLVNAQSRNGASVGYLQYSIPQGGRYQIIGVRKPNAFLEDIVISVNDVAQTARYIRSTNTPIGLEVYVVDIKVNTGDTIKVSNTIADSNSGVQMFVMKNVEAENLAIYYALGNGNPQGFLIDTTLPYLQVSRFGYYNNANVFEFYEVDHVVKQSEPVGSDSKYWYGGSYVLTLQGS